MTLGETEDLWNELAQEDPLWAVLSRTDKRNGAWDLTEFFRTGEEEIDNVLGICQQLGYPIEHNRSLDFGCGVGRLTRALAKRFARSDGVDVSKEMVELAQKSNPDIDNLHVALNTEPNLQLYSDNSFDFIYSNRVLQHLDSDQVIQAYLEEFGRILATDGILCFGLPRPPGWRYRFSPRRHAFWLLNHVGMDKQSIYRRFGVWPIPMRGASESTVGSWLSGIGMELLRANPIEENIILYFAVASGQTEKAIDPQ
jgi:SAM-dependent methyltransferase